MNGLDKFMNLIKGMQSLKPIIGLNEIELDERIDKVYAYAKEELSETDYKKLLELKENDDK